MAKEKVKIKRVKRNKKEISGKEKFDYTYWRYIQFGYWMNEFNVSLD